MHYQGWWKSSLLALALAPCEIHAQNAAGAPSPVLPGGSILLENTAYEASYNARYKQSDWIFYELGSRELRACVERSNSFRADPRLPENQAAQLSDYKGSGFDRGHLIPAGDNRWHATAMRESFLLSNISPQIGKFNGGIWGKLEGLVRAWAKNLGGLWVTTGPVLSSKLPTIGAGRVAVPEYFYKVLSTTDTAGSEAVAFLLPTDASGDLGRYAMTVDKLEEITGLDYLAGLENEAEAESRFNLATWDPKAKFTYLPCSASAPDYLEWAWGLTP